LPDPPSDLCELGRRLTARPRLDPRFTPVESPESNGMAEAFVKTFKRDYVRVNPIPTATAAMWPAAGFVDTGLG
jgi:hypothetical protein